ncbi:Uncharacterised protein [Serratia marcescens]|nr:hypothetical protein DH21_02125 [Serratia marcescens]KHO43268.1 hypothetical protein RT90_04170 [Serratia marcescens]PHY68123.1 hypothetical protein CS368_04710 [Serratia marcescens]PYA02178.1 hypothetical protein DMW43_22735 [Serratia marcescens]PYA45391.1 hypothetical protein DMW45_22210 [Serratia marcescens]
MTHSLNPKSSRDRYELMLRGYKVETLKSMLGLDPESRLPGTPQEVINGLAKQLADRKFNHQ